MSRYDQCDNACTTDCGHCKGQGRPDSPTPGTEPCTCGAYAACFPWCPAYRPATPPPVGTERDQHADEALREYMEDVAIGQATAYAHRAALSSPTPVPDTAVRERYLANRFAEQAVGDDSPAPEVAAPDEAAIIKAITDQFNDWEVYCRGITNKELAEEAVRIANLVGKDV